MQALERQAQRTATAVQNAHGGGSGSGGSGGGGGGSRQAKAATDLDALQDRMLLKDYNRRVRFEAQQVQHAERSASASIAAKAREAAQLEAIQDRYIQRDYRRRAAYEKQKLEEAKQNAAQNEQMLMGGLVIASHVAMKGLMEMNAGYEKVRMDAEAAAEATLTLRKNLRVEQTLGGSGADDALVKHLKFRLETGLGQNEASEFIKQYEGTTPIGFEKFDLSEKKYGVGNAKAGISKGVASDLMKEAATRSARQGGDAGTAAEMAGILGQFGKVESAQAGLSQLEAIRVGLVKGRGDDSPLTRQLLNVAGSLVGEGHTVPSLPEMGALIGVTSLSGGPGQAGNRANQLYRGLMIGMTKRTKVKGTDQAQGDYLKGLGIKEGDTLETALDAIVPDLQKAKDGGRDLDAYLAGKNFRASEQRRAIIETFENYGPLKQRMKEAREAGLNPELGNKEIKKNKAFLAGPQGRKEVGSALGTAATTTRGVEGERLQALMAAAEASPEIQEGDKSWWTQTMDATYRAPAGGRDYRVRQQALGDLRKRAKGAGVTDEELAPYERKSAQDRNYDPEFVNQVEALILKHGGSLDVDIKPVLEKLTQAIERQNELAGGKAKAPPALPVAPPRANQRPN